ncbi:MAG: cation transporter [Alphaproteobacteria bacterium 32-64-14]|nr:MAG: cation transporter [Alphaproteobacteria bacterium 32-64-14]
MAGCCEHDACASTAGSTVDPIWRRALWIALVVNATMFAAEIAAGFAASSSALQADALDFFADAANYAISLTVAGMGLAIRSRTALFKGATLILLGAWVIGSAGWRAAAGGATPEADVMGVVGFVALLANAGVALMLFRFRRGDADMRSVWICSRNDAIGNVAVMLAALGVFGTGTLWPDVIVAGIMAALSITGGWAIVRHALSDIRTRPASPTVAAAE